MIGNINKNAKIIKNIIFFAAFKFSEEVLLLEKDTAFSS
jgi:hypothetical protein